MSVPVGILLVLLNFWLFIKRVLFETVSSRCSALLYTDSTEYRYRKAHLGELSNLKDFCIRMKEIYWPDWDKCLYNPQ